MISKTEENIEEQNLKKDLIIDTEYTQETDILLEDKDMRARNKDKILHVFLYIIILIVCIRFVSSYVIQKAIIMSNSMEDAIFKNDNLLVDRITYLFSDPERFDIVVFYPYGIEIGEQYVKRVIGLPGETIQIIEENIFINGEILEENYGKGASLISGIAEDPIILADDEYFVMGDNRMISLDSRYEEVGPVKRNLINGQAVFRIWPLKNFGRLE